MKTGRIHILPEELARQIAAGEVVERPASIVKELIENAIDAGSSSISVEISEGGKKSIRVVDNGIGMSREDALLSVERHSTSKIASKEELSSIETLGFRGEALPSIASVSKMKIVTLCRGETVGTQLCIQGEKKKEVRDVGCPQGTIVEVRDLFYNTPARLKFLKSVNTELSYISNVITQGALAYPDIHFKLTHNNRLLLNVPPLKEELDRMAILFGKDILNKMMRLEGRYNGIEIGGYISSPSITRASRGYQYLFVNSRPIKDRMITHAVYEAYKTFITKDRNPLFFLFLRVRPDAVDVNVHPSKMEVRFENQRDIHEFVEEIVRAHLLNGRQMEREAFVVSHGDEKGTDVKKIWGKALDIQPVRVSDIIEKYSPSSLTKDFNDLPLNVPKDDFSDLLFKPEAITYELKMLAQMDNSFLLFEIPEGILFVDQHVAHERILFEKLLRDFKKSRIQMQHLLFPVAIEPSHQEAQILTEYAEKLLSLGFEVEHVRDNTFNIKGIPSILPEADCEKTLFDILNRLSETERLKTFDEMIEDILITMACHSAVKDNRTLGEKEVLELMEDLMKTRVPHTCPHGRPIMLVLARDDIKKRFQIK